MIEFSKRTIAERVVEAAYTGKEAVFSEDDTSPVYEFTPEGIKNYLLDTSTYSTFTSREQALDASIKDGTQFLSINNLDYFYDPNVNSNHASLVTADGKKWSPAGKPYLEHWGCIGDGLTDNYEMASKALSWAATARSATLYVGRGQFLTSGELVFDAPGIQIVGEGPGTTWDSQNTTMTTRIIGTSTTGSVFRVKWENCGIKNLTVDASIERTAADPDFTPTNYNGGIRFEADDVGPPEGDVFSFIIDNVNVRNQPNDGYIIVGRTYQGLMSNFYAEYNKGHGLCIDTGQRTGRTNQQVAGVITLLNGYLTRCYGQGLVVGSPNDDGASLIPTTRLVAINVESGLHRCDPNYAYTSHAAYIRGDNHVFVGCAFSGKNHLGTVQQNAGLYAAGRDHHYISCRYLDTTFAATIGVATGTTTQAIQFKGMQIIQPLNLYAVEIEAGALRSSVLLPAPGPITSAYTGSVDPKQVEWQVGSRKRDPLLNLPTSYNPSTTAAHTGSTSESTKYTVNIPANSMGVRGYLEIDFVAEHTNSANDKTYRIKFGGTTFLTQTVTTTDSINGKLFIYNTVAADSQRAYVPGATTSLTTGSIDTTSDQAVTLTVQLEDSTETINCRMFRVQVHVGSV